MLEINVYKLDHDFGFAPHPFDGVCTLACCKPDIRKRAEIGHYVVGMGSVELGNIGKLIYWMKVEDIISFDQYYVADWAQSRKPNMKGSKKERARDNIYHTDPETGEYVQDFSFHSLKAGVTDFSNLDTDTGKTPNVLVSRTFSYFGGDGPSLPQGLDCFALLRVRNFQRDFPNEKKVALVEWLEGLPRKVQGRPTSQHLMPSA